MEVLAHNGGWDEIGLVLGPIAVLAAILWLANRRAVRLETEAADGHDDGPGDATA